MSAVFSTERAPRFTSPGEPVVSRRTYFSDLIQTIFHGDPKSGTKTILFTSTSPSAGVSFVCSSIATELASQGDRVLLADAQTILNLARRPAQAIFPICQRIETSTLWVLGPRQYDPSASGPQDEDETSATAVLTLLAQTFNHIVIDAPALAASDDAVLLATAVNGTVLVVQSGSAEQQEIATVCRKLSSLGARVLGSVYNARPAKIAQEVAQ